MIWKSFRCKLVRGVNVDLTQLEKLFMYLTVISIVMLLFMVNYQEENVPKYITHEDFKNYEHLKPNKTQASNSTGKSLKSGVPVSIKDIVQNINVNSIGHHTSLDEQKAQVDKQAEKNRSKDMSRELMISFNSAKRENPNLNPMVDLSNTVTLNTSSCLPVPRDLNIPQVDLQECSVPHVIIHDGGQLGNKMCQYISLYLLRHIYGIRVSITEKMKTTLGSFFKNITLPVQDFKCFTKNTKRIMYNELYMMLHSTAVKTVQRYDNSIRPSLLNHSYYIFHHPCPREVITTHRDLVRDVLSFKDDILLAAERSIKKALRYLNKRRENVTLITVHVRRRDYVRYIMKHYNLTQLNEVYFQRAFDYYRERVKNPVFVVVSDDHPWCREVLETHDVVVAGSRKDPIIDIAVLSLGEHHIISYGTFSFMGAVLGHGTIVHPFNKNKLYDHYNCVDPQIFPPISRDINVT